MAERCVSARLLLFALVAAMAGPGLAAAQSEAGPGVRGALYESPSFGWILVAPAPEWAIAGAESNAGVDSVHLVSTLSDGADDYFVTMADDGSGPPGCVKGLVESLAAGFPAAPLQGWSEPEVTFSEFGPEEHAAYARVVRGDDPGLDLLAFLTCTRGPDGVVIGEALLRTARDLDAGPSLPSLRPLWPGQGHTGRTAAERAALNDPSSGVVRFIDVNTDEFPFSCIRQDTLPRPAEPPPPDRGWFGCDGRIVNVDTMPATIDLAQFVLGCSPAHLPAAETPPDCHTELTPPTLYEIIQGPPGMDGPVFTLAPGEFADVALWYALPEGEPPWDILLNEPDRLVVVGPTFFTQGTGSRPRVRLGR